MIDGRNDRIQVRFTRSRQMERMVPGDGETCQDDQVAVKICEMEEAGCSVAAIHLQITQEDPLAPPLCLEEEAPVRIYASVTEKPEKITAMYLYNPWWTRPAFTDDIRNIPAKTQVAFFQLKDRFACLLPFAGDQFKTSLCGGTETELCFEMTACVGGLTHIDETLYIYAEASTPEEAVHRAMACMLEKKGLPPREKRRLPEMFRYLGWCSWDAFYTEVSEEKIRSKAQEFLCKDVPVRWMLIDDGWFPSRDKRISGFYPDPAKFPDGFRKMTDQIRSAGQVRWFGVWHALGGYWAGIDPQSTLASEEAPYLYRSKNGSIIPDPARGSGFYADWCEILKEEGIDFLKVDGQSAAPFYFANEIPVCKAARGMNRALESGAYRMDGAIINCMGMAMENLAARPVSAISRNSDDFLPAKEESFAEHLLQNAYNAVYHNEIYCCDWDMFWSEHVHAVKHSLLRAVSGGPVYVSDKLSQTDPEVLKPLVYKDGRILMMSRSAKPTAECMFQDPRKGGVLKLHNTAPWGEAGNAGGIAAFNLTDGPQKGSFTSLDIPDLEDAQKYWVFDYFGRNVSLLEKDEPYPVTLEEGAFGWYVVVPARGMGACLGLLNKYAGFTAVENIQENEDSQVVILHETGPVGWAFEREPAEIRMGTQDMTQKIKRDGLLWTLQLPEKAQKAVLTVKWQENLPETGRSAPAAEGQEEALQADRKERL